MSGRTSGGLLRLHAVLSYGFLYLPIAVLIVFSFSASRYSTVWGGFSLKWYRKVMTNRELMDAALDSLTIASISTLIATVLGTLAAFGLTRGVFRGQAVYRSVLALPIVMPEIVQGIALLILFALVLEWRLGLWTIILAHSVLCLAYVAAVVQARLRGMDPRLAEAAMDLGASHWQVFRRVTLPLAWPGILGGALLAFTISFDDFIITFFVTGPGVSTLPIEIYAMVKRGVTPEANAFATMILLASAILIACSIWLQNRDTERHRRNNPP